MLLSCYIELDIKSQEQKTNGNSSLPEFDGMLTDLLCCFLYNGWDSLRHENKQVYPLLLEPSLIGEASC